MDLSLGVAGLNIPNKQQLVVLTGDLELQDLNVHYLKKIKEMGVMRLVLKVTVTSHESASVYRVPSSCHILPLQCTVVYNTSLSSMGMFSTTII